MLEKGGRWRWGQTSETKFDANNPRWFLGIYASAVVGRTLTNSVLVSRDFTDESAGSSEEQKKIKYWKKNLSQHVGRSGYDKP